MFEVKAYDTQSGSLLCEVKANLGVTEGEGSYEGCVVQVENTLPGIPDGTAEVTVSLPGYETVVYESVEYKSRLCSYTDTTELEVFLDPEENI